MSYKGNIKVYFNKVTGPIKPFHSVSKGGCIPTTVLTIQVVHAVNYM